MNTKIANLPAQDYVTRDQLVALCDALGMDANQAISIQAEADGITVVFMVDGQPVTKRWGLVRP